MVVTWTLHIKGTAVLQVLFTFLASVSACTCSALKLKKVHFLWASHKFLRKNGTIDLDCLEISVASSYKFVHVMRVASGFIGSQQSLYALW